MGEKSIGVNLVKSMGEKDGWKKYGCKKMGEKVWLNLVKSMDENFGKSMGVKDGCKKHGWKTLWKVWMKILLKKWGKNVWVKTL